MKYYIIGSKDGSFKGFTTEKEILDIFLQQRNKNDYIIQEFKKKDLSKEFIENLERSYKEIVINSGKLLFPSEEEYFIEALNQYFIDVRCCVERITKSLSCVRLDKKEKEVITECLSTIIHIVNYAAEYYDNDDCEDSIEYERYLKIDKMIEYIIDVLN